MPPGQLGFKPALSTDNQDEPEYPEAKQEIEEGLHKLETLLTGALDKNFDKFEIYVLRSVLSVPTDLVNWVRLSHYEVSAATTDMERTDETRTCQYCPAKSRHQR